MMMRWQWQRQRRFTKHKVLLLILMVYCEGLSGITTSNIAGTRPLVVNIGALLDFDSTIGKVAKVAIQAAVEDVNNHQTVLQDATLHLSMQDTNYSGFLGLVEALSLMETEIVTIIGPQYSVNAHGVSYVANELQVPLLSFAATDPTLSSLQYPFFVRATHSDLFQMAAIAELVDYFGWREVTAVYVDDDYGRNGIAALGDKLAERRCKILYKAGMSPQVSRDTITDVLVKVALMESRVLVLLAYPGWGLEVLNVAQYLGMMGSGYVWIATDWLTTVLDTDGPLTSGALEDVQGVLTLRMYTQDLQQKREFVSRWSELTEKKKVLGNIGLNTYALYAYDAVWILAYAIDTFLNQGGNISFSQDARLSETDKGIMHAGAMSIFNEGKSLLQNILQFNKTGLTGPIKFTSDRNLANPAYEIINVIGNGVRKIGYWSNQSGLSIVPPGSLYTMPLNHSTQQLHSVIWPGQTTMKPRGWVFPNNGMHLRIGVPIRVSYREFVSVEGSDLFSGYCVDVFTAALNLLPYGVPYKFYAFGDGQINPKADELLELMTAGMYDAAVGDIAITTDRLRIVDFTQPYVESGLVVVAPIRKSNSNALAFLSPFTPMMWCVTAIFFLIVGVVVWILEHRINDDFRGPPKRQLVTILWFSFSTLFFAHKENTMSTLGRFVLIIWLFVVLILNSSYIASLTSNLTVEQLSSPIKGIKSLVSSKDPIGYQRGSFTENYLTLEYNIDKSRLVPLDSAEEYVKALKDGPAKGGVAAVVDERAYMELFLSSRCEYSIVGRDFNKIGWGFAFPRDSPLAVDMSTAILKLSENGELQRIHDKWLLRSACRLEGAKEEAARLPLKSFWGLFVICGISALLAFLLYLFQMVHQFSKRYSEDLESLGRSQPPSRIQSFLSFVGEKKETKSRSKRRRMERATTRSTDGDESTNGSFKSNYSEV